MGHLGVIVCLCLGFFFALLGNGLQTGLVTLLYRHLVMSFGKLVMGGGGGGIGIGNWDIALVYLDGLFVF